MRFGLIHRVMTDALAVLGLLALITSGELPSPVSIALVVGLLIALAIPESWQERVWLKRLGVIAPVILLAAQLLRFTLRASVIEVAVEFAAGLQVLRLATRRGAAHDQQVIVLALLHLIAGTILGGGLAYGLCFVGFLIIAPGALVLSHLRREVEGNYRQGARDRTGLPVDVPRILRSRRVIGKPFLLFTCLLSVPIFFFTALTFVLFPRVGLSLLLLNHHRPERMIGFSDRVDLGGVGKLRTDPSIAMRVHYPDLPPTPPPRLALYLRGTAFDHYDGRTWERTTTIRTAAPLHHGVVPLRRPPHATDRVMTIDLEPIEPPVLFFPPDTTALEVVSEPALLRRPTRVFMGPEHQYQYSSATDGIRYRVYFAKHDSSPVPPLDPPDRARYLHLPPNFTPRMADLARSWTIHATTAYDRAKAVETHLRTEYHYDLESPSGGAANPLDHFLFESRRGHCEFYSTAMAVLLRTQGIPTRNVTGFIGGTYNRFGEYYAVRQGDAHSWVEVFIDGTGWTRFDPTPPASAAPQSDITGALAFLRDLIEAAAQRWDRHVEGYDLQQQLGLLSDVRARVTGNGAALEVLRSPGRLLLFALGIGLVIGALLWLRRRRPGAPGPHRRARPTHLVNLQIVALYRSLEAAMAARGVPRQASTPPLAHARALHALQHPGSDEILSLTEIYLDVRFGGRHLSDSERRHYARRVKTFRHARSQQAA